MLAPLFDSVWRIGMAAPVCLPGRWGRFQNRRGQAQEAARHVTMVPIHRRLDLAHWNDGPGFVERAGPFSFRCLPREAGLISQVSARCRPPAFQVGLLGR
jgi:hypothetical protein